MRRTNEEKSTSLVQTSRYSNRIYSQLSSSLQQNFSLSKMSVFRSNLFQNCVAIVTGGGTGIGRAISYELLSLGCKVVIASRNLERLTKSAEELRAAASGGQASKDDAVTPIQCNIRREDEVKSLVEAALARHGKLDFLVNNAGGQFLSPIAGMSTKGWNAVIDTNLTGTFLMCREVHRQWSQHHPGGSIVNIVGAASRGYPTMGHSSAARAAATNLTKTLAVEWAADGVRVNAVAPGLIRSSSAAANYDVDLFGEAAPHIPAKRVGIPDEVAGVVTFLLSPAASYISGACVIVDGAASLYSPLPWDIPEHSKLPPHKWIPDCSIPSDLD